MADEEKKQKDAEIKQLKENVTKVTNEAAEDTKKKVEAVKTELKNA